MFPLALFLVCRFFGGWYSCRVCPEGCRWWPGESPSANNAMAIFLSVERPRHGLLNFFLFAQQKTYVERLVTVTMHCDMNET